MEDFLSKYWEVTAFFLGMVVFMSKLYIDNTMLKFSKLTADQMSNEIKELLHLTSQHHAQVEAKIKELKNDFDIDIKELKRENRYIKDNYKKVS